ncbi:hypothetical protein [Kitasatospora sp. NPDC047058]|uniref:hypothetical protein n=1 Tax=Kitasatospora sp. NPDC047058 TaxID=3155620 RepID=UPI003407633A
MRKRLASCFVLTALATVVMAGPASAATATATAAAAAAVTVQAAGADTDPLHLVPKPALKKSGKDDGHNDLRWE